MSLQDLLGEELYKQVTEKLGDQKIAIVSDGSYIPKAKFDEKLNEAKEYKKQLEERDKQLQELGEKAKGNEELTAQIEELKKQNETTKQEYEQKLQQQAFDHVLENSLAGVKVKNVKAVKALLDFDTIKLDGDKLKGLDEQISKLKESDSYLFEEGSDNSPKPVFSQGEHKKESQTDIDEWMGAFKNT